ncbi:MAG: substrate-binding domain-containing protein [Spirochaetales bacterium]|nr:substrate-binding domain-containing protein [Spirochaetales bacterium]
MQVNSQHKPQPLIGLFIDNLFYEYAFLIREGVKTKIHETGGMLICFMGGRLDNPFCNDKLKSVVYRLARSQSIDGIITVSSSIGTYIDKRQYELFIKSFAPLPIVNIGEFIDGYLSVKADNYNGMRELVTHCIREHGCKKIAIIKGPENHEDAITRFTAYKDTLKEHNISFNPGIVVNGSFDADYGRTAIIELMDHRKTEFDALLCSNDYVAITAIQELQRRGLRVPQDIIITGFDNINTCKQLHTPLTTVHQPCFELGYQAAENLSSLLGGNIKQTSIELACRFIARQSCGCKNHEFTSEYVNAESCLSSVRLNMLDTSLSTLKEKTSNVIHFHELEEIIYESLPQFGIKSCFIFVYDAKKTTPDSESSMLILGYENYNILNAKYHNPCEVTEHIISFCKNRINKQDSVYIYPMFHRERLLGYVFYIIDVKEEINAVNTRYNEASICELLTQELAATVNSLEDYKKSKKVENKGIAAQSALYADDNNGYNLSEVQTEQYFNRVITYMEKEKPYIDDEISLYDIARKLSIPRNYISYVINNNAGITFYDFINSYRVKEAVKLLSEKKYEDMNILDVAFNCGFKAKSTFNKIFKLHTGMTPSDFKKQNKILVKG